MRKKLSDYLVKKIILHFCVDIEASKTAKLIGLNRNTINSYYTYFRRLIASYQEELNKSIGDNELVEDQLIANQIRLISRAKVIRKKLITYQVYGLFEIDNFIFTEIIDPNFIKEIVSPAEGPDSTETLNSKEFRHNYVAFLYGMFPQMIFLKNQPDNTSHQASKMFNVESFWSFCCRRLYKFNGISRLFYYHLKECEWRWKKKDVQLVQQLHKLVNNNGLM